ncbi:MAG TPA: histidine phosphatase family protein [Burkholderiales bacterium]|nr:histidine phosphatase family protein [Burkholderiales bacterium]
MSLATIYLVQPGETKWDREGRHQGHLDSPLTPRGIEQARTAGRALRQLLQNPQLVFVETSPLGRAGHTAALICAELGLDMKSMVVAPLLIEHHLGAWQGLTNAEIDAQYPGARRVREADKWSYVVPGGESYALMHERAQQWLASKRRAPVTIAVTHRMFSRILQGTYAGLAQAQTLRLNHPQDCLYRLYDAQLEEIPVSAGHLERGPDTFGR